LAASWNPLVKSNPSATAMKKISPAVRTARALHAGTAVAQPGRTGGGGEHVGRSPDDKERARSGGDAVARSLRSW
jgi:hypothetical protein